MSPRDSDFKAQTAPSVYNRAMAKPRHLEDEASYTCQSCGETIVVPVDGSAGREQRYVEDCPVCCHPHVLTVVIDPDFGATIDAQEE